METTAPTKPRGAFNAATAPTTVQKSLNGYSQNDVLTMTACFAKNYQQDISSKSISAWYSIDQIQNINNLLLEEVDTVGTDGVRFYFGCTQPAEGTTKLQVSIFPVSTKPQQPDNAGQSNHGDYYDHTADYLVTGEPFGAAIDDNAAQGITLGASLYNTVAPPSDVCNNPSNHYIDGNEAYAWVRKRCELNSACDQSPLNTRSEWFSWCFITSLFNSIIQSRQTFNLDGLRIYLGKGYIDPDHPELGERDVFVLVPTQAGSNGTHLDYYSCMEDMLLSPFCKPAMSLKVNKTFSSRAELVNHFKQLQPKSSFWYSGGYDNGELCPDVCN